MFEVARLLGDALREVKQRDGPYLAQNNIDAHANFLVGGQIQGEAPRLFDVYSEGNFIEATPETCYFQIGESKYGKPVLDRVVTRDIVAGRGDQVHAGLVRLDDALEHLGRAADRPAGLRATRCAVRLQRRIEESDPYFQMVRPDWGEGLRRVFAQLPDPDWIDGCRWPSASRCSTARPTASTGRSSCRRTRSGCGRRRTAARRCSATR